MNRPHISLVLALCLLALGGCAAVSPPTPTGDLTITLATEPARPVAGAATTLAITVASGEQPLPGARVMVVRRILSGSAPSDEIIMEGGDQGGGRYAATTTFTQSGRWRVQVIVTPPAGEARTDSFTIDVAAPE